MNRLRLVSPPGGPGASALVACMLPDRIDSGVFQPMLRDKYRIMVKRVEPRFFNGIRISAHIFDAEADLDRAFGAIRAGLG